jgi:hypothetical protein
VEGGADALGIAGGDESLAIVAATARAHTACRSSAFPPGRETTSRSTWASIGIEQPLRALDRPVAPGTRPRLDSGRLGVVAIDAPGTSPLPGRAWTATSVEAYGPASVHAGIDGEPVDLSTPLDFEIPPPRSA